MITIWDLRRERGSLCEWCNKREAEQRHHALVPDLKRFHEELTVKENIMQACGYCHTGTCVLDSYEVKQWFWARQCERYGVDHMQDWLASLPVKLRYSGRLDFAREYRPGSRTVVTAEATARTRGVNPRLLVKHPEG
jgi:hypothetical protein